ncbi:ABC transporter six-transmembrane domain-containing protein [Amycolatopsis sp. NPDC004378]
MSGGTHGRVVRQLAATAKLRLAAAYSLMLAENLLQLGVPTVIGVAIDRTLERDFRGVAFLAGYWGLLAVTGLVRRLCDTRVFGRMYATWVTGVVAGQLAARVGTGQVVARSALSREFVDFFEQEIPGLVTALVSMAGSWLMLMRAGTAVGLVCLAMMACCTVINYVNSRRSARLNRELNEQLEREVDVIRSGRVESVRAHFSALTGWRVKLSDVDGVSYGVTQVLGLGLVLAVVVFAVVGDASTSAGDIYSACSYAISFTGAAVLFPAFVQQWGRLGDIARRIDVTPVAVR